MSYWTELIRMTIGPSAALLSRRRRRRQWREEKEEGEG